MTRQDNFAVRFAKHKDELEWLFMELYHNREGLEVLEREMAQAYNARSAELKALDKARTADPEWYKRGNMFGMTMYTDLFAGNLKELAKLQREILSVVWKYVKPGGRLIYSTCTINKEENAENARWITENLPFKPEDLTEAFPLKGEAFAGLKENTYPGADLKNGQIQILPGISPFEDFDGFFISVFKRTL